MTFLLTNDDGIDAPGLAALKRAVEAFGPAVVLAPDRHLSGCSHQATTHRPLQLTQTGDRCWALDGSPVDCTRVALARVVPEAEWVFAGVNEGGNLGADVYLSGTVAAAREACLLGKRAVAISQFFQAPIDWQQAERWTRHALEMLLARPLAAGSFWNVNLPQFQVAGDRVPEVVFCPVDPHPLPVDYDLRDGKLHYRGRYRDRLRLAGHDVERCFAGCITVTRISLTAPGVSGSSHEG